MRALTVVTLLLVPAVVLPVLSVSDSRGLSNAGPKTLTPRAARLLQGSASPFVPNLGQWRHQGRFIHRAGPMTVFLEDRGWVLNLVERPARTRQAQRRAFAMHRGMPTDDEVEQQVRGVGLRMTFEGDAHVPEVLGEQRLPGHHNYFLGNDPSRWRTGVPLFASVRYLDLYPGIDLRLREVNGVPEYDLLLEPGADLTAVSVRVEGGQGLSIAADGSLVIETALGPLTQPRPRTFEVGRDGRKREVACQFTLLGPDRFGFLAPGWTGGTSLTIDPGLIWSTLLGGDADDGPFTIFVDAKGIVTLGGYTDSSGFPPTTGTYDTKLTGKREGWISRLDPGRTGSAQLVYSTFLGGSCGERVAAISVDNNGVVTAAGTTLSMDFPWTKGAYNTTFGGSTCNYRIVADGFITRLDPSKQGAEQLLYSTSLRGTSAEEIRRLSVDASGVVTVAGITFSSDFPTTSGAYGTMYRNNASTPTADVFVSQLDPRKTGTDQLVYSTFLGGGAGDQLSELFVEPNGVITVAGSTTSTNFPTTNGAYDTTPNGGIDAFVSQLDPSKPATSQLVYSTYLGGSTSEEILGLVVDAKRNVIVTGWTASSDFPFTTNAYDTTYNGLGSLAPGGDAFVSRLIPRGLGKKGLTYSTFLGGKQDEGGIGLSVDASGQVVTVLGGTFSATTDGFPTTGGAYDTTYNGGLDVFVSRLDLRKTRTAQLIYSTYLGGDRWDQPGFGLYVDPSGVATVAGFTISPNFPTTNGAYDTTYNGGSPKPPVPPTFQPIGDVFVSRLDMGVAFYGDLYEVSLGTGGTQKLTVNAGQAHAGRSYWIFGSVTGTTPGVTLGSAIGPVHIPLNPDPWTDYTIALANTSILANTKGTLDASGTSQASFNIPKINLPSAVGLVFHHAYLVYDQNNNFYMASNPVPLTLTK